MPKVHPSPAIPWAHVASRKRDKYARLNREDVVLTEQGLTHVRCGSVL